MAMHFQHLMIDLETLGTAPGAAILSLGAVFFSERDDVTASYEWHVDVDACQRIGMHVSDSTIRWWLKQNAEARSSIYNASMPEDPGTVLGHLANRVTEHGMQDMRAWSHGASFDLAMLRDISHRTGARLPWHYGAERDTRTLAELYPMVPRPAPGTAHSAVSDAKAQAIWVRAMLREHKKEK